MNTLRMIIRQYCSGTSVKAMGTIVRTSRNTIKKYIRTWSTLGMSYEEYCSKSDEELARKVGHERIASACRFAASLGVYGYMNLRLRAVGSAWRRRG